MKQAMFVICLCALLGQGCATGALNHQLSKKPVKVIAEGTGEEFTIGLSVDFFSLHAVEEHPWKHVGALLVDGAMAWGVYAIAENNNWLGLGDKETKPVPVENDATIEARQTGTDNKLKITYETIPGTELPKVRLTQDGSGNSAEINFKLMPPE